MSPDLLAKNHATRILRLALDILKRIEPICLKTGEKFQVKIGINTGPVVAGVVGEHKPQFSLVGATVNLASRMCSTAKRPDLCQISWNTYELVKGEVGLSFEMDKVTAKGYGEVTTYYVESAAMEQARKSIRKGTVFNRDLIRTLEQQQPASPDEQLDNSKIGLLDQVSKRTQVGPLSHQPTSLVTEDAAKEASQEDAEDLGLVGPVLWLMCSLRESPEQQEYRISYIERDMTAMRYGLWMTAGIYAAVNGIYVMAVGVTDQGHGSYLFICLRGLCTLSLILMSLLVTKMYKNFSFPWVVTILYTSSSLISVLTLYSIDAKFLYVVVLEVMYTNVVVNHISGLPFGFIVIASVCIMVEYLMVMLAVLADKGNVIETTSFLVLFMLLNGAASYKREAQDRTTYNLNRMSLREINNTERLLNQMMPSHVVHNLKQGLTPTERYTGVTILFADIVGFTEWSKDKTPKQIIRMLSKLFSNFDHLCVENNVYKVHTIGDCYVILGFSGKRDEGQRDEVAECVAMVNMGLSMIKTINRINREKKTDLNMRIGIHTGSITAGITGINIVRYDIYGPDVDIANRMESSGLKGRLHVSEETKNLLELGCPGRFAYEFDKEVLYQPMDRTIRTYFVLAVKESDLE
jgi:phospholipid-translocating ATPase